MAKQAHRSAPFVPYLVLLLCCSSWQARGQLGFDSLGDIVEDEGSPSPSLEHRSHFKAHRDNAAAAPGPYAEGPKARAPSAAVLPSRAVEGVAHAGAPAAGGPALPPHLQPAGSGEILPQKPRSHASVPVQAPGFVIVGGDNSTALNATQTYTPAPSAFVSDDGTLVLTGPASPGTPLSTSASADRLLWWVVAVILLVGIMCSIAWAYSRNRNRRYMDLKEADNRMTEMAAQQRHDARV
ncbi:hypothetical protein CVIRNUC_000360 [Coccomyxa viridis]|uniref:Transmembrane protein n=1 Tax=Coccomyxa viridis TaxID=1274662 RepID=A0AAV1HQ08_9CHLO|nr:hypothetical protein CVIRNUC_000360 [Coccomyxa viridis]